jgi:hypothetical protein
MERTTWQAIKLLCETYLEAERDAAVREAECIVKYGAAHIFTQDEIPDYIDGEWG